MARDFLAIPSTSVPFERVFSIAGQMLNKRRSSMIESIMNALMYYKDWLGLTELTREELQVEAELLEYIQDISIDGDLPQEDVSDNDTEEEL